MYRICYVGDGVQTEFAFNFPFFQNADVRVSINGDILDANAGIYSVIPNQDFTGGTLVFADAPAADAQIEIYRRIALSRNIDYQPTAPIDPECLNADFNFLLAAFQDLRQPEIDLEKWENVHTGMIRNLEYTMDVISDKLSGGAVLGLYNNLVSVLASARPYLINDYGSVAEPAPNEDRDDYGIL